MSNENGLDLGRCIPNRGFYIISDYATDFNYGSSTLSTADNSFTLVDEQNADYKNSSPNISRPEAFQKCDTSCYGCKSPDYRHCTSCHNGWSLTVESLAVRSLQYPYGVCDVVCSNGFYRAIDADPNQFYTIDNGGLCRDCDSTCRECIGPGAI